MRAEARHLTSTAFALGLLLLAPVAGRAQLLADADSREVMAYKLTEAGLGKYEQSARNLKGIRIDDCDDESEVRSLAEAVAKLDAAPGAKAAVQTAGMTSREYVVLTFSLIQNGMASWALEEPGGKLPPGVSQANVDFFREHAAEMERIGDGSEDAACDDAEEPEDGE